MNPKDYQTEKMDKQFDEVIESLDDIELLLDAGRKYYANFLFIDCGLLMGTAIFWRAHASFGNPSLKMLINVSYIMISAADASSTMHICRRANTSDAHRFERYCQKIDELYLDSQSEQVNDSEDSFFAGRAYLVQVFDYPDFALYQLADFLMALDELSVKVYGFSMTQALPIFLNLVMNVRVESDGSHAPSHLLFKKEYLDYYRNQSKFCINWSSLFLDTHQINDANFIQQILNKLQLEKLGLK